jgi:succinylglutamate desuccinylase
VSLALLYTAEVERIVQVIDSGAHGNEYTPGILVCQVISDMVRNIWCSY